MSVAVVLAFGSAFCFGLALVLTQLGLRDVPPLSGAAISIPSSTLLFVCLAPVVLVESTPAWTALPIFAAVGLLYPGAVTLLTFAANRSLGPVITGTLGNLAPVFAVATAAIMLGEALRLSQLGGLLMIVAGIVVLTATRQQGVHWRSWYLLLPLAAAALRGLVQPTVKLGLEIWPSPFVAALTSYLVSSLVVVAAARSRTQSFQPSTPTRGRLWFVAVGLCNGLAVLLMYAALANGPVALVSPLVATYPLVTVAGSAIILGKADRSARLALGVALTVAGVALLLAA
ncbi:MAG: EamA family transporter [Xanthobacteraceae bacterium]|jgi:drug/metabolite transporter (DMT)-like permease